MVACNAQMPRRERAKQPGAGAWTQTASPSFLPTPPRQRLRLCPPRASPSLLHLRLFFGKRKSLASRLMGNGDRGKSTVAAFHLTRTAALPFWALAFPVRVVSGSCGRRDVRADPPSGWAVGTGWWLGCSSSWVENSVACALVSTMAHKPVRNVCCREISSGNERAGLCPGGCGPSEPRGRSCWVRNARLPLPSSLQRCRATSRPRGPGCPHVLHPVRRDDGGCSGACCAAKD